MELETIQVKVLEQVDCYEDKWDSKNECHYTNDWVEEQENIYPIQVRMDVDGNILDSKEDIELKVYEVIQGELINFEVIG